MAKQGERGKLEDQQWKGAVTPLDQGSEDEDCGE